MPTWGQILDEVQQLGKGGDKAAFDTVRTRYVRELAEFTGRNTIVYASRWTQGDVPPNLTIISDEDVQAFMQAIYGLKGDTLDLVLHTGGGSAEATDAIVSYLRTKFRDIRVLIPQAAMSAGTMMACSANRLVMARHSFIGPIDPQVILQTQVGIRSVAAHAILDQFEKAQTDCRDNPNNLNSWLPMLTQYGPALLVECKNQIDFGKDLVKSWLKAFMFGSDPDSTKPIEIAEYLSNHSHFKTHGKHINIETAKGIGLVIDQLEDDQTFQERLLSAFHATIITLSATPTVKLISNHEGSTFAKRFAVPQGPVR